MIRDYYTELYEELGEDRELLKEIAEDLFGVYIEARAALSQALLSKNYEEVESIAHKLKGAMLTFNNPDAVRILRILETEASEHHFHDGQEMLSQLDQEIRRMKEFLQDFTLEH